MKTITIPPTYFIKTIALAYMMLWLAYVAMAAQYTGPVEMTFWRLCERRLDRTEKVKARVDMLNARTKFQNFLRWDTPWEVERDITELYSDILDVKFEPCENATALLELDECVNKEGNIYRIPYTGKYIKREETPGVSHFLTLKPDKNVAITLDIAASYNTTFMGRYEIKYKRKFLGHFESEHYPSDHSLRERLSIPISKSEVVTSNIMKVTRVLGPVYDKNKNGRLPLYDENLNEDDMTVNVNDIKKRLKEITPKRPLMIQCHDKHQQQLEKLSKLLFNFVKEWLTKYVNNREEKIGQFITYFGKQVTPTSVAARFYKVLKALGEREEFENERMKIQCHQPETVSVCDFHTFGLVNMTVSDEFIEEHVSGYDHLRDLNQGWINLCPDYFHITTESGSTNSQGGLLLHFLARALFAETNRLQNRLMTIEAASEGTTPILNILREANVYQYYFESFANPLDFGSTKTTPITKPTVKESTTIHTEF